MLQDSPVAVALEEPEEVSSQQETTEATAEPDIPWARWELLAYLVIILVALGLRLWDLGAQALHHDESLHAVYAWYLYDGRGYQHNPMMHGPFQFIGTASTFWLLGDSDATARVLPALFGTALVGLPLFLRSHLGRNGALVTSVLLALSPTMVYFSRFARNDIYMAVWTFLLVGLMWRYMDTRKIRYLIWTAAVLALAFATKETIYIVVLVLGSYLFIHAAQDVVPWLLGRKRLRDFSPPGQFLVLMATLILPLGAAAIALFQDRLGLTLANPDWTAGPIGIPKGTGLFVAVITVAVLTIAAVVVGLRWRPRLWLVCFGAFASIWVLLYTTFFTNLWSGLGSGLWQGLGYWVVQQDVGRGGQPWYYYALLGLNYEFLPILVGTAAIVYYIRRGDRFSHFLVYWAVANFVLYSFTSEKMPWLLVGVSLPFFVLTGKFIGGLLERRPWQRVITSEEDYAEAIPWRRRIQWSGVAFILMIALLVAVTGRWLLLALSAEPGLSRGLVLLLALLVPALAAACIYLLRQVDKRNRTALVGVSLAGLMLLLAVPATFRVAYANSDVPVELLVYTQTAPDIPQVMGQIRRLGEETGKGNNLRITVDSTDGFSWPWAWYLRDYKSVGYPCLSNESGCRGLDQPPDSDVVLLAARNRSSEGSHLGAYGPPVSYKHRWWFPESYKTQVWHPEDYKYKWWLLESSTGLDVRDIAEGVRKSESWCRMGDYFLNRKFGRGIGSVDGYAYFPKDFKSEPVGREITYQDTVC